MGDSPLKSPRKRTRRAKKQATPWDLNPASPENNADSTMMDLLMDMSCQMQAMEEYVSQHNQHSLMGNQGSIPERSSIHARPDDATAASGTQAAAGCLDSISTIAPRVTDEQVPETVRMKLARHRRWTPLLVESIRQVRDGQGTCPSEKEGQSPQIWKD